MILCFHVDGAPFEKEVSVEYTQQLYRYSHKCPYFVFEQFINKVFMLEDHTPSCFHNFLSLKTSLFIPSAFTCFFTHLFLRHRSKEYERSKDILRSQIHEHSKISVPYLLRKNVD